MRYLVVDRFGRIRTEIDRKQMPRVCMEGFREVCNNSSSGIFQLKKVQIVDEEFLHNKINSKDI